MKRTFIRAEQKRVKCIIGPELYPFSHIGSQSKKLFALVSYLYCLHQLNPYIHENRKTLLNASQNHFWVLTNVSTLLSSFANCYRLQLNPFTMFYYDRKFVYVQIKVSWLFVWVNKNYFEEKKCTLITKEKPNIYFDLFVRKYFFCRFFYRE